MGGSIPTRLSCEGSICTGAKRLSCRERVLVSDGLRRDGIALQNLPANGGGTGLFEAAK